MWVGNPHPGAQTLPNCGKVCTREVTTGAIQSPTVSGASRAVPSGPRQLHGILGGVLILAVAGFYAIALPRLEIGADDQPLAAGEITQFQGLQMTFPSGWDRIGGRAPVTYARDGATVQVFGLLPSDDLMAAIDDEIEGMEGDRGEFWVVGPVRQLTTVAGDEGVSVQGRSPIQVRQVWVIAHDGEAVIVVGRAPESVWPSMSDEIGEVALSTRFAGDG